MSQKKSLSELESQRMRILYRAARQYGLGTNRQHSVRDRVNSVTSRYRTNMFRYFGSDTISPAQVKQGVPKRFYVGLKNAQGSKG